MSSKGRGTLSVVGALAMLVLAAVVACSSDAGSADGPADASPGDGGGGDANGMLDDGSVAADGGDAEGGPPTRGFQIQSPDVVVAPGDERTACYFVRSPNTEPMEVHTWKSVMAPGVRQMIVFTSPADLMPPGTLTTTSCPFGSAGGTNRPVWTYAAHTPANQLDLPADDGAGKPLAQLIPPNASLLVEVHAINATASPITVNVKLEATALAAGAPYTPTSSYVTYHAGLSIQPTGGGVPTEGNGGIATKTCATPADTKFWMLTTHTHKRGIKTEVKNGAPASTNVVFENLDWEAPIPKTWSTAPFYAFDDATSPNQMTFTCTYSNETNFTVTSGDSYAIEEMCVVAGFVFPATTPKLCACAQQGCFIL